MSNRKNHNSILFLTTLGVYFGLVLVGATPQILAQAAMTRQFDVKDEIEVKDDLDNKPDTEEALAVYDTAIQEIYRAARDVAATIPKLIALPAYEYDMSVNVSKSGSMVGRSYKSGVDSGRYWPSFRLLNTAFPHLKEDGKDQMKVNFVLSPAEFEFKVTLNQKDGESASAFANAFGAVLSNKAIYQTGHILLVVNENTSVLSNNDQVFIVTHLPRAGLDSLLARDAK